MFSVKQLQARFRTAYGKSTTSRNRPWLLKRLQEAGLRKLPTTPGAEMRRIWRDTEYVVTVNDGGFTVNGGATYRSLSAAATAITGTNWNGHVFFGLKKRARTPAGARP